MVHALVTTPLTALIVFNLLLVAALQHPFSGDASVKPDAVESALKSLGDRQRALREQEVSPTVNAR